VSLLKPDIWNAVQRFVTCQCCDVADESETLGRRSSNWISSSLKTHITGFDKNCIDGPVKEGTNDTKETDVDTTMLGKEKEVPLGMGSIDEANESSLLDDSEAKDCEM
jgi:hypothetical protein